MRGAEGLAVSTLGMSASPSRSSIRAASAWVSACARSAIACMTVRDSSPAATIARCISPMLKQLDVHAEVVLGAFALDITERKRTEHDLRMDVELFQTIGEMQRAIVAAGLESRPSCTPSPTGRTRSPMPTRR